MAKHVINFEDYAVHFDVSDQGVDFQVYPIILASYPSGEERNLYVDKENDPDMRETFEEGKCLVKMTGSYVWRGVWEGRLYFPDEEYWSEDLKELSDLFSTFIEPQCKEFIRSKNPNAE